MSLRRDVHAAFDQIAPSMSGLSERVVQTVASESATRRRRKGMIVRFRAPLSLGAAVLLIAMVATVLVGGRLFQDWNAMHRSTPAEESHQQEVAQLEAVPLRIPTVHSYRECFSMNGPFYANQDPATIGVYSDFGSGPVYVQAPGALSTSNWGDYYHNIAFADVEVAGPILIRARDVFTNQPVLFVGKYAAGQVVGHDTVDGAAVEQRAELVLDPSQASKDRGIHKVAWPFVAGHPKGGSGSFGWQIDGVGFSEVFLAC